MDVGKKIGKKKNFVEAYDKYADAIYRHCFFRVFSRARAEELMQETFMKAWEYVAKGNEVDNLRALLYKIANNLVIDESRKKKEESLDVLLEGGFDPVQETRLKTEDNIVLKDVFRAINSLPEDERDVLVMRFVNDLNPKDIAEILGVTANVVSVRINRAIKSARDKFN